MKRYRILIWPLIAAGIMACDSQVPPEIMTVLGPVAASEMGTTLSHEHILVDFIGADSTGYHRWEKQAVIGQALPFLDELQAHGCKTFMECTPAYLGRDTELMKILARKTGLNILTNTGFYGAGKNKYIPSRAFEMSPEELAAEWTAALAHLETGLVIMSHTGPDKPAFDQLGILEQYGVSPEAFIWTHAQAGTTDTPPYLRHWFRQCSGTDLTMKMWNACFARTLQML
jgi:phosphotriesterase-related protein